MSHGGFIAYRELFFQGSLQVDLIDAQDPGLSGFVAWVVAIYFWKPLHIFVPQNIFQRSFYLRSVTNAWRCFVGRIIVQRATHICAASEAIHAAISDIDVTLGDDTLVVPDVLDINAYRLEPLRVDIRAKYPQFRIIILMVAPLTKDQNIELGIHILHEVHLAYPHVGLVIVGEGSQKQTLRTLAHNLGLSEWVMFEPWNDNLPSYYKSAHIFLVTALHEEYANTITCAAAAGCAIVTSGVGSAQAFIEQEVSGYLCDPSDVQSYVRSIVPLVLKPELLIRIRAGAGIALDHYIGAGMARIRHRNYTESWKNTISTL